MIAYDESSQLCAEKDDQMALRRTGRYRSTCVRFGHRPGPGQGVPNLTTLPRPLARLAADSSDQVLGEALSYLDRHVLSDEEVAALSEVLAHSGEQLRFPGSPVIGDVVSTGGPSSLTTLLCPLIMLGNGMRVVKLTVPGRPAGSIDTLAQVPGYNFDLSAREVRYAFDRCGFAHFLAGMRYCPLDARLYALRKKIGLMRLPQLVVASILAKKLAAQVQCVGVDVRAAPHGNLGRSVAETRENARLFVRIAQLLGIRATCFITDGLFPYQPFIGRGESLVAISRIIREEAGGPLRDHWQLCLAIALGAIREDTPRAPSGSDLSGTLREHLEAQGASIDAFYQKVAEVESAPRHRITARHNGFFEADLGLLRQIFVEAQKAAPRELGAFPDEIGLVLSCTNGTFCMKGDTLAEVRLTNDGWRKLKGKLNSAIGTTTRIPPIPGLEVVADGL